VGVGGKIDRVVGALSHFMHVRRAKHNTVADLDPYFDQAAADLFPEPPPIRDMHTSRSLRDRLIKTSTLKWTSSHRVLSRRYEVRHRHQYKRNLTAWARWMTPHGRQRRDCLIYVHGWLEPGSWVEEATLFRLWARELDIDIVHASLPFHGRRNPRGALFSGEYFWSADLVRSIEGVRQAICDTRALMAWLRTRGYDRVGVTGISLGGSLTMLTACVEPTPDYIIPIVGHLVLEDAVEEAPILWRMKKDLTRWGIDRAQRTKIFGRLGISGYKPVLSPEQQLWIVAKEDVYIRPTLVEKQWKEWGEPNILWINGGHMTFPLHSEAFTARIKSFLAER
jgi:hypothetical protein